jgi:hypothetical protein
VAWESSGFISHCIGTVLALAGTVVLSAAQAPPRTAGTKMAAGRQEEARQIDAGFVELRRGWTGSGASVDSCRAAVSLWRTIADQGSTDAQALIGLAYAGENINWFTEQDRDVIKQIKPNSIQSTRCDQDFVSEPEAATWLLRAANRGDFLAESTLAVWYATGVGFKRDFAMAYAWADIAGSQSVPNDARLMYQIRDCVSKVMRPDQIARAQAFSSSHRTLHRGPTDPRIQWPYPAYNGSSDVCNMVNDILTGKDPSDTVDDEIERVATGVHGQLGPAVPFTPSELPVMGPGGQYVSAPKSRWRSPFYYRYENSTPFLVRVLLSGPVRRQLILSPNTASDLIDLPVGQYRIVSTLGGGIYGIQRFSFGFYLHKLIVNSTAVSTAEPLRPKIASQGGLAAGSSSGEGNIRREVDGIARNGPRETTRPLPPDIVVGTTNGPPELTIENSTPYALSVTFAGPVTRIIEVDAGMTQTVTLLEGTFDVSATVTAPNVNASVGVKTYRPDTRYKVTYYIK